MPRYVFTERDLAPLRALLQLPLAHEALAASVPIKRFDPQAEVGETIELPVEVRSSANPDGVPLPEILARLKREVPSVTGIAVRGGTARVTYAKPPTRRDAGAVGKLLGNRAELMKLREQPPPQEQLRAVLESEATPDAEWLGAFRRWAVDNVIRPG